MRMRIITNEGDKDLHSPFPSPWLPVLGKWYASACSLPFAIPIYFSLKNLGILA